MDDCRCSLDLRGCFPVKDETEIAQRENRDFALVKRAYWFPGGDSDTTRFPLIFGRKFFVRT